MFRFKAHLLNIHILPLKFLLTAGLVSNQTLEADMVLSQLPNKRGLVGSGGLSAFLGV